MRITGNYLIMIIPAMKRLLTWGLLLLALTGCTSPKMDKLKYGKVIPVKDGIVLPMSRVPGGHKADWNVGLFFTPEGVVVQSPCELHTCSFSVVYENPETGMIDASSVDLDFRDRSSKGNYLYSLPYLWFPSRASVENALQVTVAYAPENADLPLQEVETPDGKQMLPDITGYCFVFTGEEIPKYFKALIEKLR